MRKETTLKHPFAWRVRFRYWEKGEYHYRTTRKWYIPIQKSARYLHDWLWANGICKYSGKRKHDWILWILRKIEGT